MKIELTEEEFNLVMVGLCAARDLAIDQGKKAAEVVHVAQKTSHELDVILKQLVRKK